MKVKFLILANLLLILYVSVAIAQTTAFHSLLAGHEFGGTLGFGGYQSYGSLYLNLHRRAYMEVLTAGDEARIYKWLLIRLFYPRHLLLQATIYPLAGLSSFMETDYPASFNRFRLFGSTNLLRSIGSGPEEPYALSLFLGNIAVFVHSRSPESSVSTKGPRQTGSALAGFVISVGHWHIQDNIRIDDRWLEAELKLKGEFNEPGIRRVSWNFRIGAKVHENALVTDVAILSLQRNHTEWNYRGWSPLRNSVFEYTTYLPVGPGKGERPLLVRHLLTFGKKYPLRIGRRSFMVRLGGGILWEWLRLFDRSTHQFNSHESGKWVWLVQPSVEF